MKVLYIIDHLRHDGTQRMLSQLIEGLASRNHQQAVLCLNNSWDEKLVCHLRKFNTEVRIITRVQFVSGFGLISACRWMKLERFDAVVTFLFVSDVVGRTLARCVNTPFLVSSIRARNIHYKYWERFLVSITARWVDVFVLNSAEICDFVVANEGAPLGKIAVIPNGVDIKRFEDSVDSSEMRSSLGLTTGNFVIGGIGRLSKQKGFDILIKAISLLPSNNIHGLLIGEGEEREYLIQLSRDLGLEDRIHFAGYRSDVERLLQVVDLYVQPSRFEGMPNALLEAMAAGLPIVASEVDGNRDLIKNGFNGWLVPPEDERALALAIDSALSDRSEAVRRGQEALKFVQINHQFEKMILAWENVLG